MPHEPVQLAERQPPLAAAAAAATARRGGVAKVGVSDAVAGEDGGVVVAVGVEAEHQGDAEVGKEVGVEGGGEVAAVVGVDPVLVGVEVEARRAEEEEAAGDDLVDLAVDLAADWWFSFLKEWRGVGIKSEVRQTRGFVTWNSVCIPRSQCLCRLMHRSD